MKVKINLLLDYLQKNKITYRQFSQLLGCSTAAVHGWAMGNHKPRPDLALRIFKKTRGIIPIEFWGYTRTKNGIQKI